MSGSNGTSKKVVLFFGTEIRIPFLQIQFFDTSFKLSRPFLGKWNWSVQMVNAIEGRILPELNFAYHLPKLWWTDRFAHGKQPTNNMLSLSIVNWLNKN